MMNEEALEWCAYGGEMHLQEMVPGPVLPGSRAKVRLRRRGIW